MSPLLSCRQVVFIVPITSLNQKQLSHMTERSEWRRGQDPSEEHAMPWMDGWDVENGSWPTLSVKSRSPSPGSISPRVVIAKRFVSNYFST